MVLNIQFVDIGLVLSLVGTFLIFLYGLSPLLSRSGAEYLPVGESEYLKRKARLYDTLSRLGILSVVTGFVFQLLGNRISWFLGVNIVALCYLLMSGAVIITVILLIRRYRKHRYDLRACYHPQFEESKPSYSPKQMWVFTITNNSKKIIEAAELHLKSNASTATIYCNDRDPKIVNNSKSISLEKIQTGESIRVHAWNIGGYLTAGHDCYLSIKNKVVRPRVYYFKEI